jgi:SAM-dependent MidA family methyltransferase
MMMTDEGKPLADSIRATIRERGPATFRWFMEQALYHPAHGFYSSGRCMIGRGGDYFTNVSVGSLFGRLMARQFCEMWERLGRPNGFAIVEQGAHDGAFANDVLEAARAAMPEFFSALSYRIIEPFPILRQRQKTKLESFRSKIEWCDSLDELEAFIGVHFSNELIDAMPVHLVKSSNNEWSEKYVTIAGNAFEFAAGPISTAQLCEHLEKLPAVPANYETEINLAALDWIEQLSPKIERGFVLAVDYGFPREEYFSPERTDGTLRSLAQHRVISSPLTDVGNIDITAHVDWTSVTKRGEQCGMSLEGFTDQHHFVAALVAAYFPNDLPTEDRRALQTLLHPGLLGRTFQFLTLARNVPVSSRLTGYNFARDPRATLDL